MKCAPGVFCFLVSTLILNERVYSSNELRLVKGRDGETGSLNQMSSSWHTKRNSNIETYYLKKAEYHLSKSEMKEALTVLNMGVLDLPESDKLVSMLCSTAVSDVNPYQTTRCREKQEKTATRKAEKREIDRWLMEKGGRLRVSASLFKDNQTHYTKKEIETRVVQPEGNFFQVEIRKTRFSLEEQLNERDWVLLGRGRESQSIKRVVRFELYDSRVGGQAKYSVKEQGATSEVEVKVSLNGLWHEGETKRGRISRSGVSVSRKATIKDWGVYLRGGFHRLKNISEKKTGHYRELKAHFEKPVAWLNKRFIIHGQWLVRGVSNSMSMEVSRENLLNVDLIYSENNKDKSDFQRFVAGYRYNRLSKNGVGSLAVEKIVFRYPKHRLTARAYVDTNNEWMAGVGWALRFR